MPTGIDLKYLQPGADQVAKGISDAYDQKQAANAALAQLIKGKQLDAQNRQAELGTENTNKLGQMKAGTDEAIREQGGKNAANLATMKQMQDNGMLQDGGSVKAGDLSAGSDPFARNAIHQSQQFRQDALSLKKESDKSFGSIAGQLEAINTIQSLIKNPNSVDSQQVQTAMARISEGQGQRLLESVISHSGGDPTLLGSATAKANYFTSGALSKLRPDQLDAIGDNLDKHVDLLKSQYGQAKAQFAAQAPMYAPTLSQTPGMLDQFSNSVTAPIESRFSQLQALGEARRNAVAQRPVSTMDKLKGFLTGGLKPTPTPTVAPQQQAPTSPDTAMQPPAPPPGSGSLIQSPGKHPDPVKEQRRQDLIKKAAGYASNS